MMDQGKSRAFFGYLFIVVLVLFAVGCGGGGGDDGPAGTGPGFPTLGPAPVSTTVSLSADAGPIKAVEVGQVVTLDGRLSRTSTRDPLTYAWSFSFKPENSTAELLNATSVSTSFTADVTGTYMVQLVVSASGASSPRSIATVVVTNPGEPPTGSFNHPNLASNCVNCHDNAQLTSDNRVIRGKTGDHVTTSNLCQACHTPVEFAIIPFVDHEEVFGSCSSCHNGVLAIGKSDNHIPTDAECDDCHTTTNFLELNPDGSFDHTGINRDCAICHNGIVATGMDDDHMPINDSDCVACHNTDGWIPASDFDHSTLTVNDVCESCHNGTNATGKDSAANHPDTTADCGMCHSTTSFAVGDVFDHTVIDFNLQPCASCHDGDTSTGKHATHLPTNEDCGICHVPGTFASGFFDHTGATDCISCHDGAISTGKTNDHVPTNQQCSVCHGSTTSFTENITFDHSGIDPNNCASCHDGIGSTGKPANHIPTQLDCSACHTDTNIGGFVTAPLFLSDVHPGLIGGCEGCHNSQFLGAGLVKDEANHLPTDQDCRFCHDNTTFNPSIFTHDAITGNCSTCHDGSFTAIGARGKADDPTPPHPDTTQDCGFCHNTINFADAFVDHSSPEVQNARCDSCHNGTNATGKNNGHLPTNEDCRVCHVPGTFANAIFDHTGIVDNCTSCHNGTNATGKPNDHVPTNEDCSVCHNTTAFAGAAFDHQGIVDNCVSCHDGATATGKPNGHIPTNDDCVVCHRTTGFIPATFDHQGIVDNCDSCHNGIFATGKTNDHVQTNQDCGVCHNTTAFFPATFDHSAVTPDIRCDSCHGVNATGKSANHIPTTLDCRNCHTTATFVGGTWDHQNVIPGDCESCHDGNTATGKPNGHFTTTLVCDTCHSTNRWAPINYTHGRNTDYPGDHNGNVGCINCHTDNNQNISYRWPQYAGTCASCHAGDFDGGEHNGGLQNNLNCGDSGCHRVSDRNWD